MSFNSHSLIFFFFLQTGKFGPFMCITVLFLFVMNWQMRRTTVIISLGKLPSSLRINRKSSHFSIRCPNQFFLSFLFSNLPVQKKRITKSEHSSGEAWLIFMDGHSKGNFLIKWQTKTGFKSSADMYRNVKMWNPMEQPVMLTHYRSETPLIIPTSKGF